MARTPSIVFSSTTNTTPKTMMPIFIDTPIPSTRIANGRSAGGGSARAYSMNGDSSHSSGRTSPIATPSATPMALPIT
jgi:hypothetical protein